MSTNNVYIGYNQNDFFYADVKDIVVGNGYTMSPTDEECDEFRNKNWEEPCKYWFSDNSLNCIKNEICNNKDSVKRLNKIDDSHNSSYVKNIDNDVEFRNTFLDTINLSLGILFLFFLFNRIQK